MRALRVVGLTEDGEVVLEDPVRLERFRVSADERLRAAARGDLSRLGQIAIELESQLRPREIQARIRAGASVEQVAAAAGVPEQKIERFAYPVLLERFRTAENAQRAHPVRPEGPDNRTLAEVVGHTFGLRGQAYEGARWDSWKGEDGRWVVALDWRAGRSHNRAHWTFQPGAHGGTVTALDEHASDLVEGLPARPLRTVGAVVDIARPEEEPPPAPSPVEQWRAAASDSYRERMPHVPEPARPPADRGVTRSAPEPWRPAPPVPRQAEPVEARLVEQRTGSSRGADGRSERDNGHRTAERAPSERTVAVEARESVVPEQARPEQVRSEPGRTEPGRTEQVLTEPGRTGQVRTRPVDAQPAHPEPGPWDRGRIAESARPSTAPVPADPPASTEPAQRDLAAPAPATPEPVVAVTPEPEPEQAEQPAVAVDPDPDPEPALAVTPEPAPEPAVAVTPEPEQAQEPTVAVTPGPAVAVMPEPTDAAPEPERPTGPTSDASGPAPEPAPEPTEPAADLAAEPAGPTAVDGAEAEPQDQPAEAAPTAEATPTPETPTPETPAGGRRTRKGKPVMPSWDEVLLGVRGPR